MEFYYFHPKKEKNIKFYFIEINLKEIKEMNKK